MLVINPDECIDCGVCEPECPAEAILPDTEDGAEKWVELNAKYSAEWANITERRSPPADADEHKGEAGKFDKYFSTESGEGSGVTPFWPGPPFLASAIVRGSRRGSVCQCV